ncbi:TIF3A1 [Symbiodinium sp. CCMP2592]|nr:TIF3A1 [Symbiodinium sp. CCMP2592]
MTSFVKPENALKRAEELLEVGKQNEALETLHHAILHKRWKNQWSPTLEKIIERHLQLCVELQKMRFAREGLHQYRATCQAANIQSLEQVVRVFRRAAEEKVNQAKKEQDVRLGKVADLEEMDAPETILLQAIQAGDTRQQSQDKDVHTHFRFLWETYKVILDVLKSNSRLEEVYHETSRQAFEFCRANTRPQEFKRLCDILRKNFQDLSKRTGPTGQNPVQPNNVDTITKTLETRCRQMQVATELDLWREAYNTSSEICDLMTALGKVNQRPKPHLRSMYYEHLGQIFWKSENYLFHAFASLKNVFFVKGAKQNMPKSELELLASRAVLAMLCVPFQENSDIQTSLEMSTDGSHQYEKAKKNAFLFSAQSVPTRDSISSQITEKNLLSIAADPCAKLFGLVESDFTPLSLCQDAKPYLDQIASDEICEGKLKDYVIPLKQIIFFRLIKQLSEVYVSMTIEDFENAASIVPFNIAETWMANASRQQGISIQINYMQKAIIFGAPTKVDMKSMRQPLIEIGYKLQQAMQCVAQEELQRKDKLEKQHLLTNIKERMEQETRSIRQRKEEIERRKEESERRKQIQEREAMERQRKEEALEAEKERRRQEEERKRREVEKQEQRKKEQELQKNLEVLEQMKKQAEQRATNLKVAGKKITEIEADDLTNISFDQIEKAREAQVLKERQDKIRQRKAESKRVDHLARALREEEASSLKQWSADVEKVDAEQLEKFESAKQEEQRKQHQNLLKEKEELLPFQHVKDNWAEQQLEPRRLDWEEERGAQIHRLTKKVVQNKIARAMQRRDAHVKEQNDAREKEKRRQQEEERRRQREIEEQEEAERQERQKREREEKRAVEEARRREDEERRERAEEKRRERASKPRLMMHVQLALGECRSNMQRSSRRRVQSKLLSVLEGGYSLHRTIAKEREIEEREAKEREALSTRPEGVLVMKFECVGCRADAVLVWSRRLRQTDVQAAAVEEVLLEARRAPRRAVAEEVEEGVDISEEAAEDAENFEVKFPVYSRNDNSITIKTNVTILPLTKTASSLLSKYGEVEMDCMGARSVFNAIRVAWLQHEWNSGISGTFRRLGAGIALRPDMLSDPSIQATRMRLHVAPVKLPEAAVAALSQDQDDEKVLKAPTSLDSAGRASKALQIRVEESGAAAIQGVGPESVNSIMKSIFRANQRILNFDADADVLWALQSRVELDGGNSAVRFVVFKAPL